MQAKGTERERARPARTPLLLRPHYVPKPWGGRRLEEALGRRDLPEGPVGESWEAIDTDEHVSRVEGGPFDGRTLREAWGGPFPLLLKILDAREDLSVQLHPDGHGGGSAKEEAWVALADGGRVALGTRGVVPADDADWMEALDVVALRAARSGEAPSVVHVPPGLVHAVLAGSLVFEVQNPYDVTWRLYDHGRVGIDGRPRALHREAAAAVLARGPARAAVLQDGGRHLAGQRFALWLNPPGEHALRDAEAVFGLARATVTLGGEELDMPAGRTAALPAPGGVVHSDGWTLCVRATPPPD